MLRLWYVAIAAMVVAVSGGDVSVRIIGGDETGGIEQYPWIVSLQERRGDGWKHTCAGTLVHKKYVLTAGHCVSPGDTYAGRIVALQYDLSAAVNSKRIYTARNVIVRDGYSYTTNDIALIELDREVEGVPLLAWNRNNGNIEKAGTNLKVVGWGYTQEGGEVSDKLNEVQLPIVSDSTCKKTFPELADDTLCAGLKNGGKDACNGDSGGPLFHTSSKGVHTQVGIVSYGEGCARPDTPGVYTRTRSHDEWIRSIVGDNPGGGEVVTAFPTPLPTTGSPSTRSPTPQPTTTPRPTTAQPTTAQPTTAQPTTAPPTPSSDDEGLGCTTIWNNAGPVKEVKDCLLPMSYLKKGQPNRIFEYPPTIREAPPKWLADAGLNVKDHGHLRWCTTNPTGKADNPVKGFYNFNGNKDYITKRWGLAECKRADLLPTAKPTPSPTQRPTSASPTISPTTASPTLSPTRRPTGSPTGAPTTAAPTATPTSAPTTLEYAIQDLRCKVQNDVYACSENNWDNGNCMWYQGNCRASRPTNSPTVSPTRTTAAPTTNGAGTDKLEGPDDEKQDETNMSTVFAAAGASVGVFLVASLGGAIFVVRKKRRSGSNAATHQVATARPLTPPGLTPQSSYKGAQMAVPRPPPGFDF